MAYALKQNGLTVKTIGSKSFVVRRPVFHNRKFSASQKAVQARFRRANRYASKVMSDPRARACYEMAAQRKEMSVLRIIVADYLYPPIVDQIDLSWYDGQPDSWIAIRATDDFEVVRVDVVISTTTGDPVENGAAMCSDADPNWWFYAARTMLPAGTHARVEVTARDRPGNKTTRTENTSDGACPL